MVGGSDSHVGVVPYRQKNFFGVHGTVDDTIEKRIDGATVLGLNSLWVTPAGLSAVWAEENTREALFDAMKRKETYATGVPMGADLLKPAGKAPSFVVWATKDPDSANLDRLQIVKGSSVSGQSFEKVYDVAWAGARKPDRATGKVPAIGSTVDLGKATYTNSIGAVELKTVWTDPDFDPGLDAFYYIRALEIATPRWSTMQAVKLDRVPPSGSGFTTIIQERAWSSPIWYTPSAQARKAVKPGVTVADLSKQGAAVLTDQQLRELVVGKTVKVRNTVTAQSFEILHGSTGRRLITAIDGKATDLHGAGEMDAWRRC